MDSAPNGNLAGNLRESLSVGQLNAEMDEESTKRLALVDCIARDILRKFDSHVRQIYVNIRNVYTVMEGVKGISKLVQHEQMHVINERLSNHQYIVSDGLT